jgi:hypothetical protein
MSVGLRDRKELDRKCSVQQSFRCVVMLIDISLGTTTKASHTSGQLSPLQAA